MKDFPFVVKIDPEIASEARVIAKRIVELGEQRNAMNEELNETRHKLWKTVEKDKAIDSDTYVYSYNGETHEINCTDTMKNAQEDSGVGALLARLSAESAADDDTVN